MNISEKIIEVLEYFADKVGIAINWTSDNILPYVQQILAKYQAYAIVENAIWIAICTIGIVGCIICGKKVYAHHLKVQDDCYADDDIFLIITIPAIVGVSIISIIGFICATMSLVRWCIVPEFQFLDMITGHLS